MNVQIKQITAELKQAMQALYGSRLNRVVLFGSYARGDFNPDSDIDFMVVLNDAAVSRLDEINRILPIQSTLNLKHTVTLSILPVSLHKYNTSTQPVYHFARSEGIIL